MDEQLTLLQTLKLNANEITCCDINGNYLLAVGSSDKTVRVLEWKKGLGFVDLFYSPISPFKYAVSCVRFSPKGVMIVSSSLDGTAVIFNAQTGSKVLSVNQPSSSSIKCCDFSPDSSKLITGGEDGVFCFWDILLKILIRKCKLNHDEFSLRDFSISTDSECLVFGDSEGILKLCYAGAVEEKEPRCLFKQRIVDDGIFSCDFSPRVEVLGGVQTPKVKYELATCGSDGFVVVWNVSITKKKKIENDSDEFLCHVSIKQKLTGHVGDVLSVRFNSTGEYLASTGLDNTAKLWHVSTGTHLRTFKGHKRFTTCSAFSKDSIILATGSNDKTIIIWALSENLTIDSDIVKPCNVSTHFSNTNLLTILNSKKESQNSKSQTSYKFTKCQEIQFSAHVNCIQFFGNEFFAVADGDKTLTIWEKHSEKFVRNEKEILNNLKYSIGYLEISPCGNKIASCSKNGAILLWDLKLGITHEMKTPICVNGLRTCRFSPNSKYIAAAGDDQEVCLWDAHTLEFIRITQSHEDSVTSVAFTPNNKLLVSTSNSGDIVVYSFDDNKSSLLVNAHDLGVTSCDISLSTVSKSGATEIYSSDKRYNNNYLLATCGKDALVKLWQVASEEVKPVKTLSGHGSTVNYVRFSPSETCILASCGADSTVRLWHVKSGLCLYVLNVHQNEVTSCSFSQDSILLATGSLDKSVLLWHLTKQINPETKYLMQSCKKPIQNWSTQDIANWFENLGSAETAEKIRSTFLNGWKILETTNIQTIGLHFKTEEEKRHFELQLAWLKKESNWNSDIISLNYKDIPHKFTCPLTHEVMKDPVICEDGYTYERQAIAEWFLSGNISSPITKECLKSAHLTPNSKMKKQICEFLYINNSNRI